MIWHSKEVTVQLQIDRFYSFFEIHYPDGFHFPGEAHNFWECVFVLDGSIWVSGDERIYRLEEGSIIFHKPMELHKFTVDSSAGATLLIFSFSLQGNVADSLKNKVFLLSSEQRDLAASMLHFIRDRYAEYRNATGPVPDLSVVTSHMYLFPFEKYPTYSQQLTTYVYQLMLSLIGNGSVSEVVTTPEALIFRDAVNYMNSHIHDQPSVTEIALFCNVSESTLKRIFDKYSGISIHKYFLKLKMNTAIELLRDGLSVTEAAETLHFSSQAYFSTVFKRETGRNPSEMQRGSAAP